MKETELAAIIVEAFRAKGMRVYQEVQPDPGGPIADIMILPPEGEGMDLHVIETKLTLNGDAIAQARRWRERAQHASVGIVKPRRISETSKILRKTLRQSRLGLIEIDPETYEHSGFNPVKNHGPQARQAADDIIRGLTPEHQTQCPAGSQHGDRVLPPSDFRNLCERLVELASKQPGIYLVKAVEQIDHKYHGQTEKERNYNAARTLGRYIKSGKVKPLACLEIYGQTVRNMRVHVR